VFPERYITGEFSLSITLRLDFRFVNFFFSRFFASLTVLLKN
jgi:hypothetical protein